jgi:hypothetical protein
MQVDTDSANAAKTQLQRLPRFPESKLNSDLKPDRSS